MPNTLAHLGIQGLTTQTILKSVDPKWVFIGCIIPDLPWILQRALAATWPGIDYYDLRLYVVVQATLCFCLILSAAMAFLTTNFWKTFTVLSLNSFLHLLLDACQTKWANGVHFLAPLDWEMINFGFFWPENLPSHLLTAFGLAFVIWSWKRTIATPPQLIIPHQKRLIAFAGFISIYYLLPFFIITAPEQADNHFVKTLREHQQRKGRNVELDRARYRKSEAGDFVLTFAEERIKVDGLELERSGSVSIKGIFVEENRIRVDQFHSHIGGLREKASYIGLALITILWAYSFYRKQREEIVR